MSTHWNTQRNKMFTSDKHMGSNLLTRGEKNTASDVRNTKKKNQTANDKETELGMLSMESAKVFDFMYNNFQLNVHTHATQIFILNCLAFRFNYSLGICLLSFFLQSLTLFFLFSFYFVIVCVCVSVCLAIQSITSHNFVLGFVLVGSRSLKYVVQFYLHQKHLNFDNNFDITTTFGCVLDHF